jgi:hypothetical protein
MSDPFPNKGPQDGGTSHPVYSPGPQLFDPALYAFGGGHLAEDGLTAAAGGGQDNALPLAATINRIKWAAAAGDSVALPASTGGQIVGLSNRSGVAVQVFAAVGSGDTINGVDGAEGVALPAGRAAMFLSPKAGAWFWVLSA